MKNLQVKLKAMSMSLIKLENEDDAVKARNRYADQCQQIDI